MQSPSDRSAASDPRALPCASARQGLDPPQARRSDAVGLDRIGSARAGGGGGAGGGGVGVEPPLLT